MSNEVVFENGRVIKDYESNDTLREVWAWYMRRTARCIPVGLSASWNEAQPTERPLLSYIYVEGHMPRDWQAVHDTASRYIWGKVLGAGSVPFSAVMVYTDYCMQRAHLLWGPEPEGGRLGTDHKKVVAFRKAMMTLRALRCELHACEDVHGDLTLENCVQKDDGTIVFLDPGNARGLVCIELDQAKLLQSYDGWETVKANTAPMRETMERGVLPPCILPRPYYGRVQTILLLTHYVRALCYAERHGKVATRWMLQRVDEILENGGWL